MDNFRHLPFSSRRYFVSATGMVVDTDSNELPVIAGDDGNYYVELDWLVRMLKLIHLS